MKCEICGREGKHWAHCPEVKREPLTVSSMAGSVPRYLSEQDTSRLIAIAVKYVDKLHPDWDELLSYILKFDQNKKAPNDHVQRERD